MVVSFFSVYHIGNLLRKCNVSKEKGVPVIDIFKYKLCNVFKRASMYMQMKTDSHHFYEVIDPELTIERALETYVKKGYSRE